MIQQTREPMPVRIARISKKDIMMYSGLLVLVVSVRLKNSFNSLSADYHGRKFRVNA